MAAGTTSASKKTATLSSMTGFAAAQGGGHGWSWTVDIRSVNGRGLDVRYRLPDWIEGLEPEMRKALLGRLQRGTVNVGIRVQRDETAAGLTLNTEALSHVLSLLATIEDKAASAGLKTRKASPAEIAAIRGVLDTSDNGAGDVAALRSAILKTVAGCIDAFLADRAREGGAIAGVIAAQIDRVEALVADARATADDREASARAAMERAIARLMEVTEVPDEARLTQELAVIAVKNDVTEEIDRLGAHIAAARGLLAEDAAVGRKFDFLMQEFNREANTLCSKSQSTQLTAVGLDLKALIDQMREQVQNIE